MDEQVLHRELEGLKKEIEELKMQLSVVNERKDVTSVMEVSNDESRIVAQVEEYLVQEAKEEVKRCPEWKEKVYDHKSRQNIEDTNCFSIFSRCRDLLFNNETKNNIRVDKLRDQVYRLEKKEKDIQEHIAWSRIKRAISWMLIFLFCTIYLFEQGIYDIEQAEVYIPVFGMLLSSSLYIPLNVKLKHFFALLNKDRECIIFLQLMFTMMLVILIPLLIVFLKIHIWDMTHGVTISMVYDTNKIFFSIGFLLFYNIVWEMWLLFYCYNGIDYFRGKKTKFE